LKSTYGFDGLRIDTVPEVHPDFWSEFSASSGVYCVGEVFNGNIDYVSSYQKYMDGVLSYPLYFTMLDVFGAQHSMTQLETLLGPAGSYWSKFANVNYLGTFVDNHDNPRFLHSQPSWTLYKNALAMTVFSSGIPIVYYGSEQGYSGGDDPANRESLWPNYNTNHELYQFIKVLVTTRKALGLSTQPQVQRYSSGSFYSFSRASVLVCLTNSGATSAPVTVSMSYLPYLEGQTVCNVLSDGDCATVANGSLLVKMTDGLPKVFVPKQ
jgi:alpha-amylase